MICFYGQIECESNDDNKLRLRRLLTPRKFIVFILKIQYFAKYDKKYFLLCQDSQFLFPTLMYLVWIFNICYLINNQNILQKLLQYCLKRVDS